MKYTLMKQRSSPSSNQTSLLALFILLILTITFFFHCSSVGHVLFQDDFSYPDGKLPAHYWAEGSERVRINNGRLHIDANPDEQGKGDVQSTVWLNKVLAGDVHIAFDAHVVSAPDNENNINFFLFYADNSGTPLYESRQSRKGKYKAYHQLNGYIFTYVANGNPDTARFRLRDNPGFNLLAENQGYECRQGKTYHIEIKKKGNHICYLVDGTVYLDVTDDRFNASHQEGLIGFRTWRTELWFDNLTVGRL